MNILRLSTLSLTLAIAVITLGYANPSFAAPKSCADHPRPSCPGGGGGGEGRDETFYDVEIGLANASDRILGESDDDQPWLTFGNGTSIGLNDSSLSPPGPERPGIGEFTDLSFFTSSPGPFDEEDQAKVTNGQKCFPANGDEEHGAITPHDEDEHMHRGDGTFSIHEGNVREGRHGRAQAGFFFHGFTHTLVGNESELRKVLYHLLLTGVFGTSQSLPPTGTPVLLSMLTWQLTATNESHAIKIISCIGDGPIDDETFNVTVTVTEHK